VVVHPAPVQWHELQPPVVIEEIIIALLVALRAPTRAGVARVPPPPWNVPLVPE
jgi:hypothetical protein